VVRYSSHTTMQLIVYEGGRTPAHIMCEQSAGHKLASHAGDCKAISA
jgi:hypothetical protein